MLDVNGAPLLFDDVRHPPLSGGRRPREWLVEPINQLNINDDLVPARVKACFAT